MRDMQDMQYMQDLQYIQYIQYIKYITLHYITLRYMTLPHITLQYNTIHYNTIQYIIHIYIAIKYIYTIYTYIFAYYQNKFEIKQNTWMRFERFSISCSTWRFKCSQNIECQGGSATAAHIVGSRLHWNCNEDWQFRCLHCLTIAFVWLRA